jgi:NAD(P)-dependent dehydrogenase (short-subunit alcohol dehydrogenase family)
MQGKVVFITGAASGIGLATARLMQQQGARVVLVDCDGLLLAQAAQELAMSVLTIVADVTNQEQCQAAVSQTLHHWGRIDVVWANAGIASLGPLMHTDPAAWKRCLEVNVLGVFNTVRAALPAVLAQKGYVLVTASVSSFAHPPAVSAYAASKAAVEAMCNAWRIELDGHGVGLGVIHASWVKTPLVTEGNMHPAFLRLRKTMPGFLNQEIEVDDAARMIVSGLQRRARRIWVPGWVRMLFWFRAFLHTKLAERELLKAAPDIERLFLEGMAISGVQASSYPPREYHRVGSKQ